MGLLIHSACILCGTSTRESVSLCGACRDDFPQIEFSCQCCGLPVTTPEITRCGECLVSAPAVDYTFTPYYYQAPVDYLVKELKFQKQLSCSAILGSLLCEFLIRKGVQDNLPEAIIPAPLHKNRLRKRGFNQSLEIARPISKALDIPIDITLTSRNRQTQAQSKLTAEQRNKNIKGCFEVANAPPYKHVVLLDDVVTTGVTTNELAQELKQKGVETVGVWSVARVQ